jgi:hypothetical protein
MCQQSSQQIKQDLHHVCPMTKQAINKIEKKSLDIAFTFIHGFVYLMIKHRR